MPTTAHAATPPRVLVLEDDALQRESLADLLTDHGYEVQAVDAGPEAIACVLRGAFHAAVLDLRLPGMTGEDVFALLRRVHPEIGVVFLTGAPERLAGRVPCPVLPKPTGADALLAALESVRRRAS
jgi:DNA-binding response OmpR family regulator